MNMKLKSAITIALGSLLLGGCCTHHHAKAWDYKVLYSSFQHPLEPQLQQAAAEGWEVVSSGGGDNSAFTIVRKPK
jgi:hypothetical protein